MPILSELIKEEPGGTRAFPIYKADTVGQGKVFAEASMGFLGRVEYVFRGDRLTVRASTEKPVLATLGCQLAGWQVDGSMISGPVRMRAKKPGFVYERVKFGKVPELPDVACVEGGFNEASLINTLIENGIESAEIIHTDEGSEAQYINIPARAIEIALFRLSFLTDINGLRITRAMSSVTTSTGKKDPSPELNDAIRFNGKVTLVGDFRGFREFEPIVTKHTGLADQRFSTVINETGSLANCPLELFSVSQLTVLDSGKTRVF